MTLHFNQQGTGIYFVHILLILKRNEIRFQKHTHTYCGNMDVPTNITMLWCRFVFIKSEIEQKAKTDQN